MLDITVILLYTHVINQTVDNRAVDDMEEMKKMFVGRQAEMTELVPVHF